ncbi:MAG: preprotein translocase subunit SecE [Candidatus Cloacimonetes bacterium]|nr:preprotein translocase subunit SecE [Candidatus Cloacimonadota bacterium]HNZ07254.1 preprotein translocase subunit SecE [Candidatus Cloacimonadota bacterium]HOH79038.1 preprotein translocase subunit SecE [Candidatus Cloacimonadota bacterium]HPN40978.1 preprotein translocase subunit SecE [Candidatus Cloacimonadota bacterium]
MKFDKVTRFFHDVRSEMRSVTWPTKADLKEGTIVVIVMSALVAIFLALVDLGFSQIVELVF